MKVRDLITLYILENKKDLITLAWELESININFPRNKGADSLKLIKLLAGKWEEIRCLAFGLVVS